jgi:neutral ceramidase
MQGAPWFEGDHPMTRVLTLLLVVLVVPGCAPTLRTRLPEPTPLHPPPSELHVGAARVDITPMPGYAMGGHGPGGTIARGYWLRLYARAVYMEDSQGMSLALVSCDLWSMPGGLADRVAEIVHERVPHLGREQILLAATHTHQSPGNFSTARSYNDFGSRRAGFDPELFDFLARRIAKAIAKAVKNAEPCSVVYRKTAPIPDLFRNRSVEAFALNLDADSITAPNRGRLPVGKAPPELSSPASYLAVDARIATLRFVEAGGDTIAMAAFVAAHPEAMSARTQVYSSDVFGVAATMVEDRLEQGNASHDKPVVAMLNGAEGDVSVDWNRQDRHEALSLGDTLANAIYPAAGPPAGEIPISQSIRVRYSIHPIRDQEFTEISQSTARWAELPRKRRTARRPVPGVAFAGGAEDGRTVFYDLGFVEGTKGIRRMPTWYENRDAAPRRVTETRHQGSKQPMLDLPLDMAPLDDLSKLFIKAKDFPDLTPIAVYEIGEVAVVAVPAEFTTMMGKRAKEAVTGTLTPPPQHIELVGLANEYLMYVTTPEEYEAQHYEGAATLYGPASGPYFLHRLVGLSGRASPARIPGDQRAQVYLPGPKKEFTLRDIGEPPLAPDDGLEQLLVDDQGNPFRTVVGCRWSDGMPAFGKSRRITPRVSIVRASDGSVVDDDEGLRFVTVALEASGESSEWVVFWLPTDQMRAALANQRLLFRIKGIDGTTRKSAPFNIGTPPARRILTVQ